jgi:hypothetical protein
MELGLSFRIVSLSATGVHKEFVQCQLHFVFLNVKTVDTVGCDWQTT